ncbi:MAG: hypothetical protein AAGG81_03015, partial [Chlamydiota bacterium]
VTGGETLRPAVFIGAEHLSEEKIQGGLPYLTIPPLLEALEKIDSLNSKIAKSCLEDVLEYEKNISQLGICNQFLINDLENKIKSLKPKQILGVSLAVMWTFSGHVVMGSIERKENGKFLLRVHNAGDGRQHHYTKRENGRELIQTYETEEIEEDDLIDFMRVATSLRTFRPSHDTGTLYYALKELNGNKLPESENPSLWNPSQTGYSCSGHSYKCFIKSILSEKEFEQFEKTFLSQAVNRLQNGLENGYFWEKSEKHQMALKDLSLELSRLTHENCPPPEHYEPSTLSEMTAAIDEQFWKLIFRKNNFEWDINEAYYAAIDLKFFENFKEAQRIRASEMLVSRKKKKYKNLADDFYSKLNEENYTNEEWKFINDVLKNLFPNCYSEKGKLFKIIYTKELNISLVDEKAIEMKNIIQLLSENKLKEARKSLSTLYPTITSENLSDSNRDEMIAIFCDSFSLQDPNTLEDIELRAGLASTFKKLGLELPTIQVSQLKKYRGMKLNEVFPESPWRQDCESYQI